MNRRSTIVPKKFDWRVALQRLVFLKFCALASSGLHSKFYLWKKKPTAILIKRLLICIKLLTWSKCHAINLWVLHQKRPPEIIRGSVNKGHHFIFKNHILVGVKIDNVSKKLVLVSRKMELLDRQKIEIWKEKKGPLGPKRSLKNYKFSGIQNLRPHH